MELKIKYQYTYFIYPYTVKEQNFQKYILGLLKNKKCRIRFFEKEKDLDIYNFFLPKMKQYMFRTFDFSKEKIKKFNEFDLKMKSNILAKYPCTIFEYDLGKDIQGKAGDEAGIFFKLQKIEIICFNTGICFILLKTNIEDTNSFSDLLDFNYKFSEINSELNSLKKYENINLQTNQFENITRLSEIISEITQNSKIEAGINIDTNKFYTYAYGCIEQEYWNADDDFKNLENEFLKFANVEQKNNQNTLNPKNIKCIEEWEFAKIGISKLGMCMFTSSINTNNYTKLAYAFENQYLYMYIWELYKKILINKISKEFDTKEKYSSAKRKLINFSKQAWIYEITNDDIGEKLDKEIRDKFNQEKLYLEMKNKYDIIYKELNIEKNTKINKNIAIGLAFSLIINIVIFIILVILK